jgi:hypothetical protein
VAETHVDVAQIRVDVPQTRVDVADTCRCGTDTLVCAVRQEVAYARGGWRIGAIARRKGVAENIATTSVEEGANERAAVKNTAGSRTRSGTVNDAGAASLLEIEQFFSQPACLRNGHEPDALQQHAAPAADDIIASDGNVIAAIRNAVRNLRTLRL